MSHFVRKEVGDLREKKQWLNTEALKFFLNSSSAQKSDIIKSSGLARIFADRTGLGLGKKARSTST